MPPNTYPTRVVTSCPLTAEIVFSPQDTTARAHATKSFLITADPSGRAVKNASFLRLFPVAQALRPSRDGDTSSEARKEVRTWQSGTADRPCSTGTSITTPGCRRVRSRCQARLQRGRPRSGHSPRHDQVAQRMHDVCRLDGGGGRLPVRTQLLEVTRRGHRGGQLVRQRAICGDPASTRLIDRTSRHVRTFFWSLTGRVW
jgi:hypothetical protein